MNGSCRACRAPEGARRGRRVSGHEAALHLADTYPDSAHVSALGLEGAPDRAIWARAAADGFVLVTKDEDFHRLSVLLGPPPKVVWVRLGNCTTEDVARLLRFRADEVNRFVVQDEAAFLELG